MQQETSFTPAKPPLHRELNEEHSILLRQRSTRPSNKGNTAQRGRAARKTLWNDTLVDWTLKPSPGQPTRAMSPTLLSSKRNPWQQFAQKLRELIVDVLA